MGLSPKHLLSRQKHLDSARSYIAELCVRIEARELEEAGAEAVAAERRLLGHARGGRGLPRGLRDEAAALQKKLRQIARTLRAVKGKVPTHTPKDTHTVKRSGKHTVKTRGIGGKKGNNATESTETTIGWEALDEPRELASVTGKGDRQQEVHLAGTVRCSSCS